MLLACAVAFAVVACGDDGEDDDKENGDQQREEFSSGSRQAEPEEELFLIGVDANYIPELEQMGMDWRYQGTIRDPLELFAQMGADAFRLRVWVVEQGSHSTDFAVDLALRAKDAGLRPYPVIFLSDDWADVGKQPRPAIWQDQSFPRLLETVRNYCRDLTGRLTQEGLEPPFYEVGNEIDYGLCGVFAAPDQMEDLEALKREVWNREADLIRACQDGVLSADPNARFMLHIMNWFDPEFVGEFFGFMMASGVELDILGFSFYPTFGGTQSQLDFYDILDVAEQIGLPAIVAESAYPSDPDTGIVFPTLNVPVQGYPLTPEGQSAWLRDLLLTVSSDPRVQGYFYFSPELYHHPMGNVWNAFALFDENGEARPALDSLSVTNAMRSIERAVPRAGRGDAPLFGREIR